MLRVYVNDILELAIYDKFNIGSKLGIDSHTEFSLGVSASTASDL